MTRDRMMTQPVWRVTLGAGIVLLALAFAVPVQAEPDQPDGDKAGGQALKPQSTCPIMGGAIDPAQYLDYGHKRIFVCCPPCVEKVKADPDAAIATLAARGEAPGQALCPIMGRTINPAQYVDHEGARVYVCCGTCLRRAKADPGAALQKLREKGVVPAKAVDKPATEKAAAHNHHQP